MVKPGTTACLLTASLMLGLLSGGAGAQDEGGGGSELGVGLYLGNCESLVAGAALYDLGDAELETEEFADADENAAGEAEAPDLESELEGESSGDETDVEGAVEGGDGDTGDGSDEEVVVQDVNFLVWVNAGETFDAAVVDLVDAPFAIAVRRDAPDGTKGEDGDDFLACGTFGGAVAGDELVLPLRTLNDSGFTGISVLAQGEREGESVSSLYLFRDAAEDELAGEEDATAETDGEAAEAETSEAEETDEADATEEVGETDEAEENGGTPKAEDVAESEEAAEDEETAGAEEGSEAEETPPAEEATETPDSEGTPEAEETAETVEAEATPEAEESAGGTFITPTPTS